MRKSEGAEHGLLCLLYHIFLSSMAFVMLAYAHAFKSGVAEAREWLAETFDLAEKHFWEPAAELYGDEARADWTLLPYRGQNANMHACEAMIYAYSATGERRYIERAETLANAITRRQAALANGLIWEHYHQDWSVDWEYNLHDKTNIYRPWGYQPGHFAEWAKLLLFVHQHDPQPWLLDRARSLFDEAMATGFDELHGGLYYSVAPDGTPCSTGKYSWVQAETIAAAAFLASALGDAFVKDLHALADHRIEQAGEDLLAADFALGLALVRPDLNVVAVDGDGAALMRMGVFATLGAYGPSNLTHVLLDNGAHDSTGGQATVSPNVSFAGVAAACGYASAVEGDQLGTLDQALSAAVQEPAAGPRFVALSIRAGTPDGLPRPTITPVDVKTRLARHIGADQGADQGEK